MSIIISAFCALSLSPTLSAGLLKGGKADSIPLLGPFFKLFNKGFNKARDWYVEICARLIRHMVAVHPAAGRHDRPSLSPG